MTIDKQAGLRSSVGPLQRPAPTPDEEEFWRSGADGRLRMQRCGSCRRWQHPPNPVCFHCLSRDVAYEQVSGEGIVYSFTINHQPWLPHLRDPYAVIVVELDEQPGLRFVSRLVDTDVAEVRVGLRVRVVFEPLGEGLFAPLFKGGGRVMTHPERQAVIRGFGSSEVGRRLPASEMALTVDACLAALADAGVGRDEIDGLATFPGGGFDTPGLAGPGADELHAALGLQTNWKFGGPEGGQLSGFFSACLAVATGLARHVLVYRTVGEASAQGAAGRAGALAGAADGAVSGFRRWLAPFDAHSPANWIALYAQRHMHEFGTTRAHLGAVAVNNRRNAAGNPNAVYRTPMTLDDYFNARMISTPFGLLDCDVPCDGSVAFVVSHVDTADDGPHPAIGIESIGWAMRHRPLWDQWADMTEMAAWDAADHLWERSDLRPDDVDQVQLYDGFSFLPLAWLEALRFCGKGESGPFLESGKRIALDGRLPLNTGGGQLSAGRLHGCGLLYEACVQLRGQGGDRQAGRPDIVAVGVGGGPTAGAALLVRR